MEAKTPEILSREGQNKNERIWVILCHLTALCGFIGIPFGAIIGPLVIWLIKKNEIPLVDVHGKEALNFQISMAIYFLVSGLLCFILIGFPLLIAVVVTDIVCIIIASIKTSNGEPYKYPLAIQFFR